MIISFFHVAVPAERSAAFEASWSQRAGLVDKFPGFLGIDVLRDAKQAGKYIVMTRWDSQEHFDAWANSPEFTAGHARGNSGNATGLDIEFYEVVPSSPA
jgi:heme oxygenase (mycobilin-producing)